MEQNVTMRDKKEDIYKAYEQLLAKYKEKEKVAKSSEKEAEVKKIAKETVVKRASTYSVENIIRGVADLKLDLSKALTELADKLVAEAGKLEEIQQAIDIETKNIEEIYDIKVAAEALDMLIRTHEEKKKAFQDEMAHDKEQWEKEQRRHEIDIRERDAELKRHREREAEEYDYNLNLSKKKGKDAYEEEKALLKRALREEREVQERELKAREDAVAAQEAEIAELRAKVESFPAEHAKGVEQAKKEAVALVQKEAQLKAELMAKEVEGQRNVAALKIKNLEDIVAKQATYIEALNKQVSNATAQVQEIAVKAVEGSSGLKVLSAIQSTALERAKEVNSKK